MNSCRDFQVGQEVVTARLECLDLNDLLGGFSGRSRKGKNFKTFLTFSLSPREGLWKVGVVPTILDLFAQTRGRSRGCYNVSTVFDLFGQSREGYKKVRKSRPFTTFPRILGKVIKNWGGLDLFRFPEKVERRRYE
jgi:hypothetical protein